LINGVKKSFQVKLKLYVSKMNGTRMAFLFLVLCNSFQRKIPETPADRTKVFFTKTHNPDKSLSLIIFFKVLVHGKPLLLNKTYRNPFGEIFEITRLRFYVGDISPVYDEPGNKHISSPEYHLIDLSDSSSSLFEIPVESFFFQSLRLQLGIDSADQCQGAQTGVLDPLKGMYWTWNSGYLSLKMEGVSDASEQPAHLIAYHIGGYRPPYSTIQQILLTQDKMIRANQRGKIILEIPIELDRFFNGPTSLRIKEISDCTTPGDLAKKISENFAGSFTGFNPIANP
jgi:hypothetical protein